MNKKRNTLSNTLYKLVFRICLINSHIISKPHSIQIIYNAFLVFFIYYLFFIYMHKNHLGFTKIIIKYFMILITRG